MLVRWERAGLRGIQMLLGAAHRALNDGKGDAADWVSLWGWDAAFGLHTRVENVTPCLSKMSIHAFSV